MNVARDFETPMQMLTTEKYIAARAGLALWNYPARLNFWI